MGQDLVERYALTVALIAFSAPPVAAMCKASARGLNATFTNISSTLSSSLT